MQRKAYRRRALAIHSLLAVGIGLLYARVLSYGTIRLDDPEYIFQNPMLLSGFDLDALRWSFTTTFWSSWQPVTWLAHLLDMQLFGVDARGHHLSSIVLHVVNTLLVSKVLHALTGKLRLSAYVALLFAIQPLQVETVVWIAARKHLLATCFGLLSLLAYTRYAKAGRLRDLGLSTGSLIIGLMAKTTLVTLPFLFVLLDIWPLRRLDVTRGVDWWRSLKSKGPLWLASGAFAVVAYRTQSAGVAITGVDYLPFTDRLLNAGMSYVMYLWKAVWPFQMSVLYPHPYLPGGTPWSVTQIGLGLALLVVVTGAALWWRRRFAMVGWLWYIGTLVPMLGLVQFGWHGMANRFAYWPLIGVLIICVWAFAGLQVRLRHVPAVRWALVAVAWVVPVFYVAATSLEIRNWADSETLFTRSLEVAPGSATLHINLGNEIAERDRPGAIAHYENALKLVPGHTDAHANLGIALVRERRFEEALAHLQSVRSTYEQDAHFQYQVALALQGLGRRRESAVFFRAAAGLAPQWVDPRVAASWTLATDPSSMTGDAMMAVVLALEAAKLTDYRSVRVLDTLAAAYAANGQFNQASQTAQRAIDLLESSNQDASSIRGRRALYDQGRPYKRSR